MTNRIAAAFALAAMLGAVSPAAAQESASDAGRAAALDRMLGPNADLPRPDAAPALTWPPAHPPPWLAAQPYRQQPLLSGVPVGGKVGARVRGGSGP